MQSSKPYSDIINEPSESDLWHQYNVKELINFTFKSAISARNNVVNFKMLQIVLYLLAHQLNILEQVVEIKEEDRSKAIKELQQYMASDSDLSSTDNSTSNSLTADDSKHDRKEKHKREMKQKKGKSFDERLTLDESDEERKQKGKMIFKSKIEVADERSPLDESEDDQNQNVKMKLKPKKVIAADEILPLDESQDDQKQKRKMKLKSKKEKAADEVSTTFDLESDVESKIGKTDRKELKSERIKLIDDASSLGGSKHSGEGKTKKEKITQSVKSKKEEIYDDDDETLTSDDSDQTEQKKEVEGKDEMAKQSKKRRMADDAFILDEPKDDEIQTDKKREHKMRSKQEKRRKTDDTYDTHESENYEKRADKKSGDKVVKKSKTDKSDKSPSLYESKEDEKKADTKTKDKKMKSKTSKADDDVHNISSSNESADSRIQKSKGKTKSIRSKISEDSVTSDESEDDKTMLDKKSKERLEVKTKEGKTAYSTRSHSGKQPAESKSEAKHKKGKKSKDTTSAGSQSRQSSIELATRSQFELLVSYVKKLLQQTGPVPTPTMPDNEKLKDDLAKGSASLPVAMEAMQINARVIAAEEALTRMADLLNQLAAVGIFPPETLNLITQLQEKHDKVSSIFYGLDDDEEELGTPTDLQQKPTDIKSVEIDASSEEKSTKVERASQRAGKADEVSTLASASTFASQAKSPVAQALTRDALVTRADMIEALRQLREDMLKKTNALTTKATAAVEKASNMAIAVAESLDTVISVDKRIDTLDSLTSDYADQLSGFDSGLTTQLQSLQEQMVQLDAELKDGLAVFDMSDKVESSGVMELRRGYDKIMVEVHRIIRKHKKFVTKEDIFTEDLKKSIEGVERLIEQKADWDEVADGLRDKVNITRLADIPKESAFETTHSELTRRIQSCYGKFIKQNQTWSKAISELTEMSDNKAEITDLLEFENFTKSSIKEVRKQLHDLEITLGVPKAAIIIKHIPRVGAAGPSTVPALVQPSEKHYSRPTPSPASSIHEKPVEEEPCLVTVRISGPPKIREHICKRWVGGSHTLVTEHTTHENVAPSLQQKTPTRQYTGIGVDGHSYLLEEELQPCIECNEILSHMYEELPLDQTGPVVIEVGGGDQNLVDDNQDKKV